MIIILLLMFLPVLVLGNSTGTISGITSPTTAQIIIEEADSFIDFEDKLNEINRELAKNPDKITGQALTVYKTNIIVEERHRIQGRNYTGYIHYPIYEVK